MKKSIKVLFCMIITAAFLFSCSKPVLDDNETDIENQTQETDINIENNDNVTPINVDYTVKYYDIVSDQWNEYSATAVFRGSPEAEFFIDEVSKLMGITITVNNISIENDKMTIDFASSSPPLNGTGSYEENCILESISSTLFGVFSEINYIHITQDGKEYDSGHLSLPPDTPYATRISEKLG